MFRIAPIVLFAASLCSLAAAQAVQEKAIKQVPAAKGTVISEPLADGAVKNEPLADGTVTYAGLQTDDVPSVPAGFAYLQLSVDDVGLHAFLHDTVPGFWGVFGLSLTPALTSFKGLPPLLSDAVVMAYGYTSTQDLELKAPLFYSPAGAIMVYAQALIFDKQGAWASDIMPLVIGENPDDTDKRAAQKAAVDQARAKATELAKPAIN